MDPNAALQSPDDEILHIVGFDADLTASTGTQFETLSSSFAPELDDSVMGDFNFDSWMGVGSLSQDHWQWIFAGTDLSPQADQTTPILPEPQSASADDRHDRASLDVFFEPSQQFDCPQTGSFSFPQVSTRAADNTQHDNLGLWPTIDLEAPLGMASDFPTLTSRSINHPLVMSNGAPSFGELGQFQTQYQGPVSVLPSAPGGTLTQQHSTPALGQDQYNPTSLPPDLAQASGFRDAPRCGGVMINDIPLADATQLNTHSVPPAARPRPSIGLSRSVTLPSARRGGRKGRLSPQEREARRTARIQGHTCLAWKISKLRGSDKVRVKQGKLEFEGIVHWMLATLILTGLLIENRGDGTDRLVPHQLIQAFGLSQSELTDLAPIRLSAPPPSGCWEDWVIRNLAFSTGKLHAPRLSDNDILHDRLAEEVPNSLWDLLFWITLKKFELCLFRKLQRSVNKLSSLSQAQLSETADEILRVLIIGLEYTTERTDLDVVVSSRVGGRTRVHGFEK
ncbi:Fc.00g115290.m01.CDS01 [Cosmosporella sp. VM-42]